MKNKWAYYNDNDPFVCKWVRNLIKAGLIMDGEVDERSITEVQPEDLKGFIRQHWFCGICGWDLALQYAGWPEEIPVVTGSCPCQPFSAAGKQKADEDERHLWPAWFRLIRSCRPPIIFGEQVEAAIGIGWLDRIQDDLAEEGYTCGAVVLPACSVGAPHIRQRIWWVAFSSISRCEKARKYRSGSPSLPARFEQYGGNDKRLALSDSLEFQGFASARAEQIHGEDEGSGGMGNAKDTNRRRSIGENNQGRGIEETGRSSCRLADPDESDRRENEQERSEERGAASGCPGESGGMGDTNESGLQGRISKELRECTGKCSPWSDGTWIYCCDGKYRRIPGPESGILPLAPRLPGRVGQLRSYGNSIVPQVAAEFIKACLHCGLNSGE